MIKYVMKSHIFEHEFRFDVTFAIKIVRKRGWCHSKALFKARRSVLSALLDDHWCEYGATLNI